MHDALESITDQSWDQSSWPDSVLPYLCDHAEMTSLLSLFMYKISQVEEVISKVLLALSFYRYGYRLLSSRLLEKI